jgi:hypothetical protein
VELSGVALVQIHISKIQLANCVVGLLRNERKDVGTDVAAAKGVQIPVGLDGGNLREVVWWVLAMPRRTMHGEGTIEIGICSAVERLRDSAAEKNAEDTVLAGVGVVFVEGYEDQSVLHEVRVVQQRLQEGTSPRTGNGDRAVVTIGGHVGSDEHLSAMVRQRWGKVEIV